MTFFIRPYRTSDFEGLYAVWQAALGTSWPLSPEFLRRMTSGYERYQEGDHFVAEQDGQVVGFAATQTDLDEVAGGIPLLMVRPDKQRQGIGTKLHEAAMERLHQKEVDSINLAHGGGDNFWPGVPIDLPGAVDFFEGLGWDFPDTSYDLTRDLTTYETPFGVLERLSVQGIEIRPCSSNEVTAVLSFERRIFPFWLEFFQMTADDGRYEDILVAWDGKTVVGSLLIEKPVVAELTPSAVWHQILGDDMGTIGAVGVDEAHRRHGIGLALVAKASEILQMRGVDQCLIGWTDLLSFYGRLGYTPWRSYAMTED